MYGSTISGPTAADYERWSSVEWFSGKPKKRDESLPLPCFFDAGSLPLTAPLHQGVLEAECL